MLKARQTGLSNTIAIEAVHLAVTRPDSLILFVSRNELLARQLVSYCQHTLYGLDHLPRLEIENQGELGFANGSRILSLPANPSTGRGFAATRAYLDEFAFCAYDALIYESIIGTVSTGGAVTVLSTPNGRGNLFFRLWQGLEGGAWSRHHVRWSDCPRYDAAWAERTRAGMTRQSWAQEYDCDFIASGEAAFRPEDLAACRGGEALAPAACARTITAWDVGRRHDHTVGITLGEHGDAWHVVGYERFLAPYPEIQRRIEARAAHSDETWVESNGVGDPVIENLSVPVRPWLTTARTKAQAVDALKLLVERRRFRYRLPEHDQLDRELILYQLEDRDLVQDSVMAAAIAAHATGAGAMPFGWMEDRD